MAAIGIDLHSYIFYVGRERNHQGKLLRIEKRYAIDADSLGSFKDSLAQDDYVLKEISTNSFWFREQILPYVKGCLTLNLNGVRYSGNKTDKTDARRLLDILSYYLEHGDRISATIRALGYPTRETASFNVNPRICRSVSIGFNLSTISW